MPTLSSIASESSPATDDTLYGRDTSEGADNQFPISAVQTLFGLTPASAAGATSLKFYEDTDNGTNYVDVKGPTSAAANRTITLPDKDGTVAVTSDVDAAVVGLLEDKGNQDCSANPNYPAASKGDVYTVSVAGKIGGASGIVVEVGDTFRALADNAGGSQASVGTSWAVVQANLVGAYVSGGTDVTVADGGTGASTAAGARTNLGIVADVTTKVYRALITQAGSGAPTATIQENSLGGTPTLARTGAGVYTVTLTGAFLANKPHVQWTHGRFDVSPFFFTWIRTSDNVLTITTVDTAFGPIDMDVTAGSLEILVYP